LFALSLPVKQTGSIKKFMSNKKTDVIVEVSEEEYQADLAQEFQADEVLNPGRHTFKRGGFLARRQLNEHQIVPPAKVRILINLDLDVLTYFKQRAAQPNAAPYQTQINHTLRAVMEQVQTPPAAVLSVQAEVLLADPQFIEAVAQRIQARQSSARKRNRTVAINPPA